MIPHVLCQGRAILEIRAALDRWGRLQNVPFGSNLAFAR